MFIKLYKKTKINAHRTRYQYKKKPLENDNQTLEAKTNKFACKGTCITQLFITKLKLLYDPRIKDSDCLFFSPI
jgi:hypothetical protein